MLMNHLLFFNARYLPVAMFNKMFSRAKNTVESAVIMVKHIWAHCNGAPGVYYNYVTRVITVTHVLHVASHAVIY